MSTEDPAARGGAAVLAALAAATLATGLLWRRPGLVAPSAGLLGAAYAVSVAVGGGPLDVEAPLVASALLLACELGYWSHELRTTAPDEPGVTGQRLAWLALLAALAILPGAAMLAAADLVRVEGIAVEALGTLAACALVVGAVLAARDRRA